MVIFRRSRQPCYEHPHCDHKNCLPATAPKASVALAPIPTKIAWKPENPLVWKPAASKKPEDVEAEIKKKWLATLESKDPPVGISLQVKEIAPTPSASNSSKACFQKLPTELRIIIIEMNLPVHQARRMITIGFDMDRDGRLIFTPDPSDPSLTISNQDKEDTIVLRNLLLVNWEFNDIISKTYKLGLFQNCFGLRPTYINYKLDVLKLDTSRSWPRYATEFGEIHRIRRLTKDRQWNAKPPKAIRVEKLILTPAFFGNLCQLGPKALEKFSGVFPSIREILVDVSSSSWYLAHPTIDFTDMGTPVKIVEIPSEPMGRAIGKHMSLRLRAAYEGRNEELSKEYTSINVKFVASFGMRDEVVPTNSLQRSIFFSRYASHKSSVEWTARTYGGELDDVAKCHSSDTRVASRSQIGRDNGPKI